MSMWVNVTHIFLFYLQDFDGDDMISSDDLKMVINRLTGKPPLTDEDMNQLIENVYIFCFFPVLKLTFIQGHPKLNFYFQFLQR